MPQVSSRKRASGGDDFLGRADACTPLPSPRPLDDDGVLRTLLLAVRHPALACSCDGSGELGCTGCQSVAEQAADLIRACVAGAPRPQPCSKRAAASDDHPQPSASSSSTAPSQPPSRPLKTDREHRIHLGERSCIGSGAADECDCPADVLRGLLRPQQLSVLESAILRPSSRASLDQACRVAEAIFRAVEQAGPEELSWRTAESFGRGGEAPADWLPAVSMLQSALWAQLCASPTALSPSVTTALAASLRALPPSNGAKKPAAADRRGAVLEAVAAAASSGSVAGRSAVRQLLLSYLPPADTIEAPPLECGFDDGPVSRRVADVPSSSLRGVSQETVTGTAARDHLPSIRDLVALAHARVASPRHDDDALPAARLLVEVCLVCCSAAGGAAACSEARLLQTLLQCVLAAHGCAADAVGGRFPPSAPFFAAAAGRCPEEGAAAKDGKALSRSCSDASLNSCESDDTAFLRAAADPPSSAARAAEDRGDCGQVGAGGAEGGRGGLVACIAALAPRPGGAELRRALVDGICQVLGAPGWWGCIREGGLHPQRDGAPPQLAGGPALRCVFAAVDALSRARGKTEAHLAAVSVTAATRLGPARPLAGALGRPQLLALAQLHLQHLLLLASAAHAASTQPGAAPDGDAARGERGGEPSDVAAFCEALAKYRVLPGEGTPPRVAAPRNERLGRDASSPPTPSPAAAEADVHVEVLCAILRSWRAELDGDSPAFANVVARVQPPGHARADNDAGMSTVGCSFARQCLEVPACVGAGAGDHAWAGPLSRLHCAALELLRAAAPHRAAAAPDSAELAQLCAFASACSLRIADLCGDGLDHGEGSDGAAACVFAAWKGQRRGTGDASLLKKPTAATAVGQKSARLLPPLIASTAAAYSCIAAALRELRGDRHASAACSPQAGAASARKHAPPAPCPGNASVEDDDSSSVASVDAPNASPMATPGAGKERLEGTKRVCTDRCVRQALRALVASAVGVLTPGALSTHLPHTSRLLPAMEALLCETFLTDAAAAAEALGALTDRCCALFALWSAFAGLPLDGAAPGHEIRAGGGAVMAAAAAAPASDLGGGVEAAGVAAERLAAAARRAGVLGLCALHLETAAPRVALMWAASVRFVAASRDAPTPLPRCAAALARVLAVWRACFRAGGGRELALAALEALEAVLEGGHVVTLGCTHDPVGRFEGASVARLRADEQNVSPCAVSGVQVRPAGDDRGAAPQLAPSFVHPPAPLPPTYDVPALVVDVLTAAADVSASCGGRSRALAAKLADAVAARRRGSCCSSCRDIQDAWLTALRQSAPRWAESGHTRQWGGRAREEAPCSAVALALAERAEGGRSLLQWIYDDPDRAAKWDGVLRAPEVGADVMTDCV